MNAKKWAVLLIGAVLFVAIGWGVAYALNGLTGNPSSAYAIADMRTAAEKVTPSVNNLTMGKTFRIYREVDFSDYPTSPTYVLEIGTVPAYSLIRDSVIEIVTAEDTGGTTLCDLKYADTVAVNDFDIETTGTVANATLYATRGSTTISLVPVADLLDSAVVRVWVCGEVLTERD